MKTVIKREYEMFATNLAMNAGATAADKNRDKTSKKDLTDEENELIRLFGLMCNKRLQLELSSEYDILGPKFSLSFPDSRVKFTKSHWRFLHSGGRKGQHLPKYKGDYFNIVSQWFKTQINELQQKINVQE